MKTKKIKKTRTGMQLSKILKIYIICMPILLVNSLSFASVEKCLLELEILVEKQALVKRAPVVRISSQIEENSNLAFIEHAGSGQWDTALAMNINYEPILSLREQISANLQIPLENLDFFKGWDPRGEAHITTLTPVEWWDTLRPIDGIRRGITIEEIHDIARSYKIQSSDVTVYGIGSGRAKKSDGSLDTNYGETFFVIVNSRNLLRIRRAIYQKFLKLNPNTPIDFWDPEHFYPHITIGYTAGNRFSSDIHEHQGLIKNMTGSLDPRFNVIISSN